MVSEEVSDTDKDEERKPPREPAILRVLRAFNRREGRAKAKKKKEESDHQKNERMMAQWTARVGYFTGALVLFSAVGNWIIYGQLHEMKSSSEDTKLLVKAAQDSAKAAQDAVAIAKDTAQRQLRAYMFVEDADCRVKGNRVSGSIIFRNSGSTPATNFVFSGNIFTIKDGIGAQPKARISQQKMIVGNNWVITMKAEWDMTEDDELLKSMKNESAVVFIAGIADYQDIYGQSHHLKFRFRSLRFEGEEWIMLPDADGNESN